MTKKRAVHCCLETSNFKQHQLLFLKVGLTAYVKAKICTFMEWSSGIAN